MNILGIKNRTENWRTAYHFSPFFGDKDARLRLAKELLARHLGRQPSQAELGQGEVGISLFWFGMRDYLKHRGGRKDSDDKNFAERYRRMFIEELNLRKEISEFIEKRRKCGKPTFPGLKDWNYLVDVPVTVSGKEKSGSEVLGNNLFHTEIDIVLTSPNCLFIGEAKYESKLRGEAPYVLVHQLIRQYVMASILLDCLKSNQKVIPFVVRDTLEGREQAQVDFMVKQGWLKRKNELTWEDIQRLSA